MTVEASAAKTALHEIQVAMGANASILQHLPVEKVRLLTFTIKPHERRNSMPVRMFYGHIKEGKNKDLEVWILLQKDHAAGRSPAHYFTIFDRLGNVQGNISADDAVRQTNAEIAFKCLKTSGVIDMDQLRSTIKYYFIAKMVSTPLPWIVGAHFVSALSAACRVAGDYNAKAIASKKKEKSRDSAAQNVNGIRSSVSLHDTEEPVKVVREQAVAPTSTIAKVGRTLQPPNPQRAPMAPMILSNQVASDLFIPEGPSVKATSEVSSNKVRNKTSEIPTLGSSQPVTLKRRGGQLQDLLAQFRSQGSTQSAAKRRCISPQQEVKQEPTSDNKRSLLAQSPPTMPEAMRIPPSHPHPFTATTKRPHSTTVNDVCNFLMHSDSEEAEDSTPMDISGSASARAKSAEVLVSHP
jgi:hypothetical protein